MTCLWHIVKIGSMLSPGIRPECHIPSFAGSNNVREDTALRFQLPTPDDPQQLAELIGLKEGASRGTDTKFVASNPLAKNQQQKVSSATRKQGAPAAVSSPLIRYKTHLRAWGRLLF